MYHTYGGLQCFLVAIRSHMHNKYSSNELTSCSLRVIVSNKHEQRYFPHCWKLSPFQKIKVQNSLIFSPAFVLLSYNCLASSHIKLFPEIVGEVSNRIRKMIANFVWKTVYSFSCKHNLLLVSATMQFPLGRLFIGWLFLMLNLLVNDTYTEQLLQIIGIFRLWLSQMCT